MNKCFNEGHIWRTVAETDKMKTKKCRRCGKTEDFNTFYSLKYASINFGSKGTPGYNEPGYNEGLGQYVTSKRDYYEKAKQQGAVPTE